MQLWTEIRRRVLGEGLSKRQACREYGLHWDTLTKILEHSEPPGCVQVFLSGTDVIRSMPRF